VNLPAPRQASGFPAAPGSARRWVVYILLTAALASSVLLRGGVVPSQWVWVALGVATASCLALWRTGVRRAGPQDPWCGAILVLLLAWMALQLVPLPPGLVAFLSPGRFAAVEAARAVTGADPRSWIALSLAPAATLERLLFVAPAMAAFLACGAGTLARSRLSVGWLAAAPVVAIALLEAVLGMLQCFGAHAGWASGTYVNPNHFAGLLELAFPFAAIAAVLAWKEGAVFRGLALSMAAACLLAGILLSLSRMGMVATLAAATIAGLAAFTPHRRSRWLIAILVPVIAFAVLAPNQLVSRFARLSASQGLSQEGRLAIWSDTLHVISAYPWTGCGLGAYQRGLYEFKHVAPLNTVDYAHNDYLQILAELGIPGALLFAALAVFVLRRTLTVVLTRRDDPNWGLALGILGALLAAGIHSLADFNLYIPANALALAWLAGTACAIEPTRVP